MPDDYYIRIADAELRERLETIGAVLIEGPKWCGKTRTGMENSCSHLLMQDPDKRELYLQALQSKPSLLLAGATPRLLDEWQTAPILWDAVRFTVDQRGEVGQFILTGSAVPRDNAVFHTGAGRIARMMMRPMSLFESRESSGAVSIGSLFEGNHHVEALSSLSVEGIALAIVRGGWPASLGKSERASFRLARDYVEAIINQDVSQVDGIQKNPARVRALMRSLSRNVSTLASLKTLREDIEMGDTGDSLTEKSISLYLSALDRVFVTDNTLAWNPSLRSKSAIRTTPKRQFVDPSIATAVLRATPVNLLQDFLYFGFLFESLCSRDLKIYAEANDGMLYHYRDSSGLECDAIIALNDGRWAAVEVKLGSRYLEDEAANLLKLRAKVNTDKMREPSFLMILTGGEFAYKREDGILVVPLGCLKN